MKIEISPPDGILVIKEEVEDCDYWHLLFEDETKNTFDIVLDNSQMLALKRQLNLRSLK
jgi:hypothetical protein